MILRSKKLVALSLLIAIGSNASLVWGAEVVLRRQAKLTGPIVRLGDIADIGSSSTEEMKNLKSTPLMPAPAPGSQEYIHLSQVRDLLVSRGVDVGTLRFGGEAFVEIGGTYQTPQLETIESDRIRSAPRNTQDSLEQVIHDYLQEESGHDHWKIELVLLKADQRKLAKIGTVVQVEGGRRPWTGRQRFLITGDLQDEKVAIYAKVVRVQTVLFAREAIAKGNIIRLTDLELREHEGRVPTTAYASLNDVVGMEAARSIRPDTIVQESHVKAPLQVQRGESATVFARTGGITVKSSVVARQDGAMGDLIQVETVDSKEQFTARVSGRRRLEVLPAGNQASDYATLRPRTRRR